MKTYKVSTSIQSHLGYGKMFLVSAEDESQVLAWFAMNYGLATIDADSVSEASAEDVMYYQQTGGRVHQTNARQRRNVLSVLDAIDYAEHEKLVLEERQAKQGALAEAAKEAQALQTPESTGENKT